MRRWRVVFVAVVSILAGAAVAGAAGLRVTAKRLTTFNAGDQLPVITCRVTADADGYIDELSGLLGSNFGTASELRVQSLALGNRRTFVRFPLADCNIPSSARVSSARVRLKLTAAPGSSRTYDIHRATAAWTEGGLTWSNQPTVASAATASAETGTSNSAVLEWDVAADVRLFVAGTATNRGWRVRDRSEGALLGIGSAFAAREHGTPDARPKLVVAYEK